MPIEETLQEENLTPQVVLEQVSPPIDQVFEYRPGIDGTLRFQTGEIIDPNEEDRLFWVWFINYEPTIGRGLVESGPGAGRLQEELGAEGITLNILPCANSNLLDSPTTIHRVELVVTDRPFRGDSDQSKPNARPFQEIADNATSIKLIWYLNFDDAECP